MGSGQHVDNASGDANPPRSWLVIIRSRACLMSFTADRRRPSGKVSRRRGCGYTGCPSNERVGYFIERRKGSHQQSLR